MSNFTIDLEKQLSKLGRDIQQFVEKAVPVQPAGRDFNPDCDVVESDKNYTIFVDLPGMSKKEVKLTLKNRVLTISGERELFLEDNEELIRSERRQGAFSKAFALPELADESSVSASFTNGVLKVTLSKTGIEDDSEATSIPIK
jgi:HSP20 family protein